jgi:hypothetical protein
MIFIFYLSALGLILSIFAHLVTFFGFNLAGYFPLIYFLHFGIFLAAIPLAFMKPFVENSRGASGWHNVMLPVPEKTQKWLKWLLWYFVLNFIVAVLLSWFTNKAVNQNNEAWSQIFNLHFLSAGWICFYSYSAAITWYHSQRQNKILYKKRSRHQE